MVKMLYRRAPCVECQKQVASKGNICEFCYQRKQNETPSQRNRDILLGELAKITEAIKNCPIDQSDAELFKQKRKLKAELNLAT